MLLNRAIYRQLQHARVYISTTSVIKIENSDDSNKKDSKNKKNEAAAKLQNLLEKMASEKQAKGKETSKLPLAKPVKKVVLNRPSYKIKLDRIKDDTTVKLVSAVKDVADEIGGDVLKTESELLHMLLNNTDDSKEKNVNELIAGMKIDKTQQKQPEISKAERVRSVLADRQVENVGNKHRPSRSDVEYGKPVRRMEPRVPLYSGTPLDIFKEAGEVKEHTQSGTWDKLVNKELKTMVTHPPKNIWEEMIIWTNQGKLWQFPINNEQGLDSEFNVDFTQHVFLDEHLEPWCPKRGPIRHFMELVCVGLGKNPYITVQAKIDHILWFRDYFEEKKKLLIDVGAIETETKAGKLEIETS